MTARPDDIPLWSESGTAVSPTGQRRLIGWVLQSIIPFEAINWAWRYFGRWANHVARRLSVFDRLQDVFDAPALSPLNVNDTFFVDEHRAPPGAPVAWADPGPADAGCLGAAATGRDVFTAWTEPDFVSPFTSPVTIRRLTRDLVHDATWSTSTAPGLYNSDGTPFIGMWSDGVILVVGTSTRIDAYSAETGAQVWGHALTANPIRAVTANADLVFVTLGDGIRAYNRTTGATVWSYDHGAAVEAIAASEASVWLAGQPGGSASTIRRIDAATGADDNGDGGLGTSVSGIPTWRAIFAVGTGGMSIAVDEKDGVYVHYDAGSSVTRTRKHDGVGAVVWDRVTGVTALRGVSVDREHVWGPIAVASVLGSVPLDRETGAAGGARLSVFSSPSSAFQFPAFQLSDGCTVFGFGDVTGPGPAKVGTAARYSAGDRPRMWRRVNPSQRARLPLSQLAVPLE